MHKGKIRVLVADDEPKYVWIAKIHLEKEGYQVLTANDGETALELAVTEEPDLILLDLKMPDLSGYEVCRRIREFSTVPIIMLTALSRDADKIQGLNMGADDYVTKPFSIPELVARVRAALRRANFSEKQSSDSIFRADDLVVDFIHQRVFINEREVNLTPIEYRLLCELVKHSGRILVLEHLVDKVWGVEYEGENHLVRRVIYKLRQKIEPDPKNPKYILNKPGIGYFFDHPG
ncbi:MAG: response regulator transcription factor [Proteobacteria bacterium]|nr:response regulator transcription factor [Pseudomonadota bacterium]